MSLNIYSKVNAFIKRCSNSFFGICSVLMGRSCWAYAKSKRFLARHMKMSLFITVSSLIASWMTIVAPILSDDDNMPESFEIIKSIDKKLGKVVPQPELLTRLQLEAVINEAAVDFTGLTINQIRKRFHSNFSHIFRGNRSHYYRALALVYFRPSQDLGGGMPFFTAAYDTLDEGLKTSPNDPAMIYEQGIVSAFMFKFGKAEEKFTLARSALLTNKATDYPSIMSIELALAGIYDLDGRYKESLALYKKAIEAINAHPLVQTFEFLRLNKTDALYSVTLAFLPNRYKNSVLEAKYMLALINTRQFEKSNDVFNKSFGGDIPYDVMTKEDVALLHMARVQYLLTQGKIQEAEKELSSALTLIPVRFGGRPDFSHFIYVATKGTLQFHKLQFTKAAQTFDKFLTKIDKYNESPAKEILFTILNMRATTAQLLRDYPKVLDMINRMEDLVSKDGNPRNKFDTALASCNLAYQINNSDMLMRSIDTLQDNFAVNDSFSETDRSYIVHCRSFYAELEGDDNRAADLRENVLEILERSANPDRIFYKSILGAVELDRSNNIGSSSQD
jgi:tetratricopeptide (TPR) repeat protein